MNIQLLLNSHITSTDQPYPMVLVKANDTILMDGALMSNTVLSCHSKTDTVLSITHYDKQENDTIVENEQIVADKAIEIEHIIVDGFEIPKPYMYLQEFTTNWKGADPIINTLFLGFNGTWSINIPIDQARFYYHILWENERKLNSEEQQVVIANGEIVETFTRFGAETDIADNKIPTIDELYKLITK